MNNNCSNLILYMNVRPKAQRGKLHHRECLFFLRSESSENETFFFSRCLQLEKTLIRLNNNNNVFQMEIESRCTRKSVNGLQTLQYIVIVGSCAL